MFHQVWVAHGFGVCSEGSYIHGLLKLGGTWKEKSLLFSRPKSMISFFQTMHLINLFQTMSPFEACLFWTMFYHSSYWVGARTPNHSYWLSTCSRTLGPACHFPWHKPVWQIHLQSSEPQSTAQTCVATGQHYLAWRDQQNTGCQKEREILLHCVKRWSSCVQFKNQVS